MKVNHCDLERDYYDKKTTKTLRAQHARGVASRLLAPPAAHDGGAARDSPLGLTAGLPAHGGAGPAQN
eukprot:6193867-Pleurochrysis_carterae.AAC.1